MTTDTAVNRTPPAKARICIVDDDEYARESLCEILTADGYHLISLADGDSLLAYLEQEQPDIILLDVMMPKLDGLALCAQLKADTRWQHIPIILVTALSGRKALLDGLNAGADEFLSKPVNIQELRARVRTMLRIKQQYDSLARALKLREDLTEMAVHDMKQPIGLAMNQIYLAQMTTDPDSSTQKTYEGLLVQLQRLLNFVDDLLTLAKMENNQLYLDLTPVDLCILLGESVAQYETAARSRQISLHLNTSHAPCLHPVDLPLFQRVLDNLISNALKFSPPGSSVYFCLRRQEPQADAPAAYTLDVMDEGPGIAPAFRDRIFDKFAIAELKGSGVPQTGVGLAFCRLAIEAHGGQIRVSSNKPQGSIFTILL
jgi:signal transduction histidine kinase